MARSYLDKARTDVRRSDRQVDDDAWVAQMLRTAATGTMALSHDGQPFVNTNIFVHDAARSIIYTHTAAVGRTRAVVEASPFVCFTVMEMGRLLPASVALEFSVEYASVVLFGTASIVDSVEEELTALNLLMAKYAPHLVPDRDYRAPIAEEARRTTVIPHAGRAAYGQTQGGRA